jgi:hypothetical protein
MKYTLLFLLISTVSFGQGYILQDVTGYATSPANVDASSMSGAGTFASPLFAKNFFNANLTANADHTHAAANKITTINNLGGWSMTSGTGVVNSGSITLDSLGSSIVAPDINITSTDDIFLAANSFTSTVYIMDNGITIENDNGDTNIKSLDRDDFNSDVVGINAGTGLLTLHKANIAGVYSTSATAQSTFTVTIGTTMNNTAYAVNITPSNALSAALFYVTNKTTTTFDVVYLSGLTGTVGFSWITARL